MVPRGYVYAPFYRERVWRPYYPYSAYPFAVRPNADVRVQVAPKQTEVFVDGFYAGTAGDFDGVFKRLKDEGSDASQEEEVLGLLSHNLAQLYRTQATMRRSSWTSARMG